MTGFDGRRSSPTTPRATAISADRTIWTGVNVGKILQFVVELGDGDDTVEFKVDRGYRAVEKAILVDLGEGENTFLFDQRRRRMDFYNATVDLDVFAGAGDDTVEVRLPDSWSPRGQARFRFNLNILANMGDNDTVWFLHRNDRFASLRDRILERILSVDSSIR